MDVKKAYGIWSEQYDTNENKTRDLEAKTLRQTLLQYDAGNCLEIGCGTGKNTEWLHQRARSVTAVDLTPEMLEKAKEKVKASNVKFVQADINRDWQFASKEYDLITFSLVLEHIEDLNAIFHKAANALRTGGLLYIAELHPFKQYAGSKARFELNNETVVVDCYTHHVSEYLNGCNRNGLALVEFHEVFDEGNKDNIPRLIAMVFRKLRST
jgi:2-polyprenyl-3-methyl-5-hydroxy-6-metoxy-1,4-benzoquinol methylase